MKRFPARELGRGQLPARITRLEALSFGCLRSVSQSLSPFQILIGPNASGKTTFLEAFSLLGKIVSKGPEAVVELTPNFHDLVWGRSGSSFELAVELEIPPTLRGEFGTIRYDLVLGIEPQSGEIALLEENVVLRQALTPFGTPRARTVVRRRPGGHDFFYAENWSEQQIVYPLGRPPQSALGNLPEDPTKFPAATWLMDVLRTGVHHVSLDNLRLRRACPPGKSRRRLLSDGSNLPWLVADLEEHEPRRLSKWIAHLRTALPALESIRSVERPDHHRYLMLRYEGGREVPSERASDGTLRLLALTILAYLPEFYGIYIIEEPENGIHPLAIETLFQSLSSVYDAQILLATYSPVVVSLVEPEDLLCFAMDDEGATNIVRGSEHPMLENWRREPDPDLGFVFAAGILG